ncbi:MAG: hypothetical protein AAF733_09245 [Verrucomicrobiota bacterium]
MLFLYFLLAAVGVILFGLAGVGAFAGGLYAYRLNQYRYRFMGLKDNRSFIPRLWRRWKFSLYQPIFCIALALMLVCVLSLVLRPLTAPVILSGSESEAAMQVGSLENRVYAATEWMKSKAFVYAFLAMALTLLVINLVWPHIKLFEEVPKMRGRIRNVLIFLTTLSAFSFVSSSNVNLNRGIVTAQLKSDVQSAEDEIHRLNSASAAYRIVKDSIDKMNDEEIRTLALVARSVAAVENAKQVSETLGKEAGDRMEERFSPERVDRFAEADRSKILEDVDDWPSLEERKAKLSIEAKRAELLRNASRESMLTSLDRIAIDLGDELGAPINRATKQALGTFFSSLTDSVSSLCFRKGPRKSLATDTEILDDFAKRYRDPNSVRISSSWFDDMPDVKDLDTLSSTMLAKSAQVDADLKLKAVKAGQAAEDAADAAKAAKTAKNVLKLIF